MKYYTYYSYEEFGRGYIGAKPSGSEDPMNDGYFGSFSDKTFLPTEKVILGIYETPEECMAAEVILHNFFDVDKNPHFANRCKQTSSGFANPGGWRHSDESKHKISSSLLNNETFRKRSSDHMRRVGKGKHKRNTHPGTLATSGPNKRQYMRLHWTKEVWDEVGDKFLSRTSFHWGKTAIAKKYNVPVKTIENMVELISQGVDWDTATNWKGDKK